MDRVSRVRPRQLPLRSPPQELVPSNPRTIPLSAPGLPRVSRTPREGPERQHVCCRRMLLSLCAAREGRYGSATDHLSCADLWERAAFLEPRLPHQRADTDPPDSGRQRFARPPESDLRAPWRPSVPADPTQGSLATETAHPTPVETLRCLADRVRPERATRLKPESTAPHTYSEIAATRAAQ